MSHAIKVSDNVYDRLRGLQAPRETYSEVIDRCISTVEALKSIPDILGPSHPLSERPRREAENEPARS